MDNENITDHDLPWIIMTIVAFLMGVITGVGLLFVVAGPL